MRKLLLAIDTAGSRCAVAVHDMVSGAILAHAEPDIGRGHAEVLMGLLAEVLDASAARYADIEKIAVVVGPGSFTGLRVGVAAATGLALALDVPAVGVTTLEALSEPHWQGKAPVLAAMDAKRGELYAALFGRDGVVLQSPRALRPSDLDDFVAGARAAPILVVGTGAAIAVELLGAHRSRTIGPDGAPQIAAVARIGAARPAVGQVRPLYLRGADAKPQGPTGISIVTTAATLP